MAVKLNIPRLMLKLFSTIVLVLFSVWSHGQVRMEEDTMVIPTYKNNPPNPMPRFFQWEGHQGAQRREYPYPVDDHLTRNKTEVAYDIVHVENEYIDLAIMPEMGGRIYYAVDKTNNYTWFYHNQVVKPSLIGMLGNWVSGSMAWGYPHHHGPNTVKPMDYKVVENEDGSKTTWIANTDRHLRVSVLVGYTIYPNSSLVEMTIRPMNPTPITNSFLFWANPAVHVDSSYQVIFPPSVQYVTFHAKRDMTTWPIADGWFNGYDFTDVDVSLWKNTHIPSSYFSWDPKEGYFGGYDHNKQAGTAWIGNRYICPGMKFWADGNNAAGRLINSGLTDNNTQYIELMAGMYTDNQPDYSWIQPYESKVGTMIWFPIRELGGLKFANRNGALNLEIENNNILVRMNTTSPHSGAKATLSAKGKVLMERRIDIDPAQPFAADIELPEGMVEDDLEVALTSATGAQLMYFAPVKHHPPDEPQPAPLKPLDDPEEMASVEELYLAGLRLNQFYNPSVDPMPYYLEALRRDPGNSKVNTQLGILEIKNYHWEKAAEYLQKAVDRVTANYTRPRDAESLYYLGLVWEAQGKTQAAYEMLYRATWDKSWHTAAYYQLAEIDMQREDYSMALDHLSRSLTTGADNTRALSLKAAVHRKMGDPEKAVKAATEALEINLLNHQAMNEMYLAYQMQGNPAKANETREELTGIMRDEVQSYLELATAYMNVDAFQEAQDVLMRLDGKTDFPMLYYYLGHTFYQLDDIEKAKEYYTLAAQKPHKYCFPFREESVPVLETAMKVNPEDANTPYYLGNLLYEKQPERAIALWEKSRELDDSFYVTHRNLGFAYKQVGEDNGKALKSYEKALATNNQDPRLLFELDEVYTLNEVPLKKRYELLKNHQDVASQYSPSYLRLVTRTVEMGEYDEAIDILEKKTIAEKEGDNELRNTYLDAYLLRGLEYLKKKQYAKALKDLETALEFPIGLSGRSRKAQLHYYHGLILEKSGNQPEATDEYKKSLEIELSAKSRENIHLYYQGLAQAKLGNPDEAKQLFNALLSHTQNRNNAAFFTQFGRGNRNQQLAENHYLSGLAQLGLGETDEAISAFKKSLEFDPDHVWSKYHLQMTKD